MNEPKEWPWKPFVIGVFAGAGAGAVTLFTFILLFLAVFGKDCN